MRKKYRIITIILLLLFSAHIFYNYTPFIIRYRVKNEVINYFKNNENSRGYLDYDITNIDKVESGGINFYIINTKIIYEDTEGQAYLFVQESSFLGFNNYKYFSFIHCGNSCGGAIGHYVINDRIKVHGCTSEKDKVVRFHFDTGDIIDYDLQSKPCYVYYASEELKGARIEDVEFLTEEEFNH